MLQGKTLAIPGFEAVIRLTDENGLVGFLAIHSTLRGPAFGGIRRLPYHSEDAARQDACRLARAMTRKCALAGLPAGGAKTVLIRDPERAAEQTATLYSQLGDFIQKLDGKYICGPDTGTGAHQLEHVRQATRYVNPAPNRPGLSTAQGVAAAMRGACSVVFQDDAVSDKTVAIQGLGSVGLALARILAADNDLLGWDLQEASRAEAEALGVTLVSEVLDAQCHVLSPCALGGILTLQQVEALRCQLVCGSANNQVTDPAAAQVMHQRGITWIPDEVASAGAVIEGVYTVLEGDSPDVRDTIAASIDRIAETTRTLLNLARAGDSSPLEAVDRLINGDG